MPQVKVRKRRRRFYTDAYKAQVLEHIDALQLAGRKKVIATTSAKFDVPETTIQRWRREGVVVKDDKPASIVKETNVRGYTIQLPTRDVNQTSRQ